jgi:hypothetical protein
VALRGTVGAGVQAEVAWRNDRPKFAEVKLADRAQRLSGRANHAGETAMTDAERQARLLCPTTEHSGVVPGQKRLPHVLSEDQVRQLINGNEIIA